MIRSLLLMTSVVVGSFGLAGVVPFGGTLAAIVVGWMAWPRSTTGRVEAAPKEPTSWADVLLRAGLVLVPLAVAGVAGWLSDGAGLELFSDVVPAVVISFAVVMVACIHRAAMRMERRSVRSRELHREVLARRLDGRAGLGAVSPPDVGGNGELSVSSTPSAGELSTIERVSGRLADRVTADRL